MTQEPKQFLPYRLWQEVNQQNLWINNEEFYLPEVITKGNGSVPFSFSSLSNYNCTRNAEGVCRFHEKDGNGEIIFRRDQKELYKFNLIKTKQYNELSVTICINVLQKGEALCEKKTFQRYGI
jgi:hypothetical protein